MAIFRKSIFVQAPLQKCFDYLNDPGKLTEYWPGMMEVRDIQPLANGGSCFKYTYKMAGIKIEGISEDIEIVPPKRMVSKSTGGMDAKVTWELEPVENGTQVMIENEYVVPLPVIGKLAEAFILKLNEHEGDAILGNFKARMES